LGGIEADVDVFCLEGDGVWLDAVEFETA